MTFYADLGDCGEDRRIETIGVAAAGGATIAFIVEDDAKADRYLKKLQERYKVRVIARGAGPVKDTVFVKLGPLGH